MKKLLLSIFFLLFLISNSFTQKNVTGVLEFGGGGEYIPPHSECVSPTQRIEITNQLKTNTKQLRQEGILEEARPVVTLFDWPLQQATGFNFNSYYGISNYIDQDLTFPNNLLDYNCGNRTYDLSSGYNHRGTDIFLWPFSWQMVNNDQVEVIAAAAGTIIGKEDGNSDMNCDFNNPNWNAVFVQHADGSVAWYGHMKNGSVTTKTIGQTVSSGEYLGVVASSGSSTGPHLHFEVWTDNTYTTLVDPWGGTCNSMTASSWWNNQKPYREPTLNHLMTNSSPVVFNTCPTPATHNEENSFALGSTIYYTLFFHDQLVGDVTNIRLLQPNGNEWSSWSQTSPNTYTSSWWYWNWNFPGTEPTGIWTFEVTYKGETFTHNFTILQPLPVELLSFTGRQEDKKNKLFWKTESEINNEYFEILKSEDGNSFYSIGKVNGMGTTNLTQQYSFIDHNPKNGINYYQLKQVDFDGKFDFSDIISLESESRELIEWSIFPNPTKNGIVSLTFSNNESKKSLTIYDSTGKMVSNEMEIFKNNQEINVSSFPKGLYFFVLDMGQERLYQKVLIQ